MRKILPALLFFPYSLFAQNSKLERANIELNNKNYETSLKLFRELRSEVKPTDSTYAQIVFGTGASLGNRMVDYRETNNWKQMIPSANEFLSFLEKDKAYLNPDQLEVKYWTYKDLIVAYNATGNKAQAEAFRNKLYTSYGAHELPKGIDEYYNFDKFVFNNQNIWGYEWFAEPDNKDMSSFSKHVYYVCSRDSAGNDKDQLYTLQTVRVHKFSGSEPDYVLTKVIPDGEGEQTETVWTYTFNAPITYDAVHKAITAYLGMPAAPDATSTIKRK